MLIERWILPFGGCGRQEFDKAYSFQMGRYDSKLMSDLATVAEHNGQKGRAKAYKFRPEILQPVQ